jgi:hypothetical protein
MFRKKQIVAPVILDPGALDIRMLLVRAYSVCVSIAAPLLDGIRLAALRTHDQKNGLQSSDRRGICKKHGKSGSGRTWDWREAILGVSGPVSCDGQGKAHRKWANGCAGKLFRNDSRIIQVYIDFIVNSIFGLQIALIDAQLLVSLSK